MAKPRVNFYLAQACLAICLAASITTGCARPEALRRADSATDLSATDQNVPFHPTPDHNSADPSRPAIPRDSNASAGSPFRASSHVRSVAAGTLITVQLQSSLSLSQIRPGDPFPATVVGPLTIERETLIENGAPVTGRIEAIQPPATRNAWARDPGLVRLALSSITIDGHELPLQTSSLFVKTTSEKPTAVSGRQDSDSFLRGSLSAANASARSAADRLGDSRILKGRHLTFRLSNPLTLGDANSIAAR
jgi:hypothetical protein